MLRLSYFLIASVTLCTSLLTGCDTTKIAADSTSGLFERAAPALEQYWDYELVGDAMPASIVQMEGILRIVPDNEVILQATTSAYVGYGYGWLEDRIEVADADDDFEEAEHLRARTRVMYERAWDLSKHRLRLHADGFDEAWAGGPESLDAWLKKNFKKKEDAAALLWAGQSLGARINMGMEDFDVIADLPMAKVIVQRSVELDPDYLFQSGKMLLAVLASSELPPDMEYSKKTFDEVLEATERRNLIVQVNMARFYAVALGDHELFTELLNEVMDAGDVLPEARLSNRIARRRAERYLDQVDYFFSDVPQ
jgi:hypothetical protein